MILGHDNNRQTETYIHEMLRDKWLVGFFSIWVGCISHYSCFCDFQFSVTQILTI